MVDTTTEIKKEISKLTARIQKEGKTDPIENQLDLLEHRIGRLADKQVQKNLKDLLGEIK